jgi:SlyX protein
VTPDEEARVQALEEMAAHQAKTIDELSDQLADQWKTMEQMKRTLERLTERLLGLEEQSTEAPPVTKPPHY